MRHIIIALLSCTLFTASVFADELQIKEDAPDRYVVVKGDTLWAISGRFLKSPWRWPEIWQLNKEEIKKLINYIRTFHQKVRKHHGIKSDTVALLRELREES